jgi:hypothetical protein
MLDLEISQLNLSIENAAGHEHRIHPIALRAGQILAQRIEEKYGESGAAAAADRAELTGSDVQLDLSRTSNEQAAQAIAAAWLAAFALHMGA